MTRAARITWGIIIAVVVIGAGIWAFTTNNPSNTLSQNNNTASTTMTDNSAVPCSLGTCKLDIFASDNGATFTYGITDRFTVWLDPHKYPTADLKCSPSGIIGQVSNVGSEPGTTTVPSRFEGVAAGTCRLTDNGFSAIIDIQQTPTGS